MSKQGKKIPRQKSQHSYKNQSDFSINRCKNKELKKSKSRMYKSAIFKKDSGPVSVKQLTGLLLTFCVSLYRWGRRSLRRSLTRLGLLWAALLSATRATLLTFRSLSVKVDKNSPMFDWFGHASSSSNRLTQLFFRRKFEFAPQNQKQEEKGERVPVFASNLASFKFETHPYSSVIHTKESQLDTRILWVVGYHLNHFDEPVFIAVSKAFADWVWHSS